MIPAISSLTSLISGTVTEEFKKLFKPSGLIASGVFLLLNLVLVFPVLRDNGIGPIVAFERMSPVWQLALGTLVWVTLAYVFTSLGPVFLSITSGAAFADSPIIGRLLRGMQENRYDNYQNDLEGDDDDIARKQALHHLSTQFPKKNEIAPTHLGNVLANSAQYTLKQYGAHFGTLWPYIEQVLIKEEDAAGLKKRLDENRDSLTTLSTLSILLIVVALEVVLVHLILGSPWDAVWGLLLLVVAYLVYAAAVEIGEAWAEDVRTAFDLYLNKVAGELGLKWFDEIPTDERKREWIKVSKWLAYGSLDAVEVDDRDDRSVVQKPDKKWFKDKATLSSVTLNHPSTVEVATLCAKVYRSNTISTKIVYTGDYSFAITNEAEGEESRSARGVFLKVTDSRLNPSTSPQAIPGDLFKPPGSDSKKDPDGLIHPNNKGHGGVYWYLGNLPPQTTYTLKYSADSQPIELIPNPADFKVNNLKIMTAETGETIIAEVTGPNGMVLNSVTIEGLIKKVRTVSSKIGSSKSLSQPWIATAQGTGWIYKPSGAHNNIKGAFTLIVKLS